MKNWRQDRSPSLRCPNCGRETAFTGVPLEYFEGKSKACDGCHAPNDLWTVILQAIEQNFAGVGALMFIGAHETAFEIVLNRDDLTKVNLTEHGIPADANILSIDYMPQTPMWYPTEILGNAPFKFRRERLVSPVLELYPWPLEKPLKAEPRMVLSAVWLIPQNNDESWKNLRDAFLYFVHDERDSAITPANTAVESASESF